MLTDAHGVHMCHALRGDGQACRCRPLPSGYCFNHDPALAEKRAAARKQGGRWPFTAPVKGWQWTLVETAKLPTDAYPAHQNREGVLGMLAGDGQLSDAPSGNNGEEDGGIPF